MMNSFPEKFLGKVFLGFLFCFGMNVMAGEGTVSEGKKEAQLAITSFMTTTIPNWFYRDEKGNSHPAKCFRVQFKILDDNITSLDAACVFLYDQKKELITILSSPSSEGKRMQGVPNIITHPIDLKSNKSYTLIYTYDGDETKWKYAVAAIASGELLEAKAIPSSTKLEEFDFKSKLRLQKE